MRWWGATQEAVQEGGGPVLGRWTAQEGAVQGIASTVDERERRTS